jgi:hypothetical protein
LTPPFAFTQSKYAWIMFGPSVKSVPGWWVSMVPILIGEPVAFTPGLVPQEERPAELLAPLVLDPPLEVVAPVLPDVADPVLADVDALPDELPPLLLDLLLPQPASANRLSAASSARQALILGTVK